MAAPPQNESSLLFATIVFILAGIVPILSGIFSGNIDGMIIGLLLWAIGFVPLYNRYRSEKNSSAVRKDDTFVKESSKLGG